ncbi:MAG TPA: hypothetical protein V6D47_03705 [Oscillatoriaceae cyanobacterium]
MHDTPGLDTAFPPIAALHRLRAWFEAQPGGSDTLREAANAFFSGRETDEPLDALRFEEWALLDRDDAAARFAEATQSPLLASRHGLWEVERLEPARVHLREAVTGDRVVASATAMNPELMAVGQALLGRFYQWQNEWLPSPTLIHVESLGLEPELLHGLDALGVQQTLQATTLVELSAEEGRRALETELAARSLALPLADLVAMAERFEEPTEFLESAFARLNALGLPENAITRTRFAMLLSNLWYHTPREALGGRAPAEVDAERESSLEQAIEALFDGIGRQDEAALALLDSESELALVYDLWGWPGLRLLTDWGEKATGLEILSLDEDLGAMRAELAWTGRRGDERGATVWFTESPEGWQAVEAVAELEDGPVSAAYAAAQDKGVLPDWQAPASDEVERKLRNALSARKLPMLDQATMIKAWRMTRALAEHDRSYPEAWAAAVEAMFRASLGQDLSPGQVAEMYGAKKSLVKERFQAISEALNQHADA